MRWPDLLAGLADALKTCLPDFVVVDGTWAKVPSVDAIHLQLKRETPAGHGFRHFLILIDVFCREAAGTTDRQAYTRMDQHQLLVEQMIEAFKASHGTVTGVSIQAWEPDGGAFRPTWAARLSVQFTCIVTDDLCGGASALPV